MLKYLSVLLTVLRAVPSQDRKIVIDDLLDRVEDRYKDNGAVMVGIRAARQVSGIPDDIGGDED